MDKIEIRKEYFRLRIKGHSNNQCRKILFAKFKYEVNIRTLRRWTGKLDKDDWDLTDKSRKPKTIHRKITTDIEDKIISIRNKTGYGANKISCFIEVSESSIKRILNKHKFTNPNPRRKKRIKYIRWQRNHPNSLWQMDLSDQKVKDKYCFAVVDDCSRYCIGLFAINRVSTDIIVKILDDLFKIHGKPREILTDNGNVFGLKSKHSRFDRKLNLRGIKHIRTAIHSPTTSGKIERFFGILGRELKFCNNNIEFFRMKYNHFRPHMGLKNKTPSQIYFDFNKLLG